MGLETTNVTGAGVNDTSLSELEALDLKYAEDKQQLLDNFPVTRAEFEELVDAFLRLTAAVDRFNQGSPHKIQ